MTEDNFNIYFDLDLNKWIIDKWIESEWSPDACDVEAPYWEQCKEFQTEAAAQEWVQLELNQRGQR